MKETYEFLSMELHNKSVVTKITEQITNAIIAGELKPGDRLPPETELCQSMGVGRNSIREAVKILEAYGIVYIKRAEGTFVSDSYSQNMLDPMIYGVILQERNWEQIIGFRKVIDYGILYLGCRTFGKQQLDEVKGSLDSFEKIIHKKDCSTEEIIKADNEFHKSIVKAVKNELLVSIADYIERFTLPSRLETTKEMLKRNDIEHMMVLHQQIYDVLEKRNIELIEQTVEKHYELWAEYLSCKM